MRVITIRMGGGTIMKGKYLALPLAAVLLLSACGEENDADDVEVEDPLLDDSGENDVGGWYSSNTNRMNWV